MTPLHLLLPIEVVGLTEDASCLELTHKTTSSLQAATATTATKQAQATVATTLSTQVYR
jgi:hypothetical protein